MLAYTIVGVIAVMVHAVAASAASTTMMDKFMLLDMATLHTRHLFVNDFSVCERFLFFLSWEDVSRVHEFNLSEGPKDSDVVHHDRCMHQIASF